MCTSTQISQMLFLDAIFIIFSRVTEINSCPAVYIKIKMSVFSSKDLDALLQKDKTLEEESKNLTELLAKQKEKYELLQVMNMTRIVNIKKINKNVIAFAFKGWTIKLNCAVCNFAGAA